MKDSHWNYRVVRRHEQRDGRYLQWLQLTEVYYRSGKPVMFAEELHMPCVDYDFGDETELVKDLKDSVKLMMGAFKKPILDERDIINDGTI